MKGGSMKYQYSSKHYLLGFALFFFVATSGAVAIRDAFKMFPLIFIAYTFICCFMLFGYLSEYYRYKDKYIFIYKEGLIISDRKQVIYIGKDEIDCIFLRIIQ